MELDTAILQKLADHFQEATGVQVMLVSPSGELLLRSIRDNICDVFHLEHPAGIGFIREWSEEMTAPSNDDKFAEPLSPFGYPVLFNAIATSNGPIGMLIACGFTFEEPDWKNVERMAKRHGFDPGAYANAVGKMPVLSSQEGYRKFKATFQLLALSIEQTISSNMILDEQRRKLEESSRFYHSLLEFNHAIILLINPNNGKIVDASLGAAEFYGYPIKKLQGMRFTEINISSEDEMIASIRSIDGNNVRSFPSVNKLANGDTRNVNVFLTSVAFNGYTYIFCIVQDITRQKEFEGEMRKAREKLYNVQKLEAMEALASGIAHDFNNILSSLMGYAELARIHPDRETYIQSILESGDKAKELVRQVLTFSRQVELNPQAIAISGLIGKTVKQFKKNIPSGIDIIVEIDDNVPAIFADPVQIQQLLINLMGNACQAMKEEGTMRILLERSGNDKRQVRIVVSDTGCGISDEIKPKIFDPFFTTSELKERSGLGLAIVYGIVKELKGTIEIESVVDEGTKVIVDFPSTDSRDKDEIQASLEPIQGEGERLLLIDDEESILAIGKLMLESYNYELITYQDSTQAMQFIKDQGATIDAILLDYAMPNMDGVQLINELRQFFPNIPVFIITAYYEQLPNLQGVANAVIEKPLDWVAISQILHRTLHP